MNMNMNINMNMFKVGEHVSAHVQLCALGHEELTCT
jgi:hypothetical protein